VWYSAGALKEALGNPAPATSQTTESIHDAAPAAGGAR
jgi:hypothetical protein